jgi:hypothetical protein
MVMTPYFIRLDAQDQKHRKLLEAHFRKLHGRPVAFADILRRLMAEKVSELGGKKLSHTLSQEGAPCQSKPHQKH